MILRLLFSISLLLPLSSFSAELLNREDGSAITYYLERNSTSDKSPVLLVIIQGSDCNSVSKNRLIKNQLKYVWPQADVLTVEKYGIDSTLVYSDSVEREDCPKQYMQRDNLEQRVTDIKQVMDVSRDKYHYGSVIVLGGSEGAVVANILASKVDYIDATVSFSGGGRWFKDDVLHSMSVDTDNPSKVKEDAANFGEMVKYILSAKPFELEMSNHGYGWWRSVLSVDQQVVLSSVTSPVLIIQGGKDTSVPPKKVSQMIEILQGAGKNNIDYLFYPELDHVLQDKEGNSQMSEVAKEINIWLKKVMRNSGN
ncbi:alpha/beta hydrolase family protein [Pragia fontium]|uniref:Alpha/beta hydrolase family protein n=2 Tax=Pragia fontium TaxID=82985 RepID=A0AAJ4WCZ0_9GAMM|nr:prolyl oligopeptidase family serine peptidase [Pragia fontium]GKX64490.1 alpha/beta hydrolase [Pragia fontium]SFD29989.1 Alpha/beta hydrolase family protein [Pragia fontium DSM 5563 = ATCC 49100]SUB83960.1 Predicted esterase [Pragia fontium]VEJ56859.1 Predicted esterase [Pragia fontium]